MKVLSRCEVKQFAWHDDSVMNINRVCLWIFLFEENRANTSWSSPYRQEKHR